MSPVSPVFHTVVTVRNWTQKCTQSESIHSKILDVHVLKDKLLQVLTIDDEEASLFKGGLYPLRREKILNK